MSLAEEWRTIKGYEGLYEVSSLGNVRSLNRLSANGRKLKGKPVKQTRNKSYLHVKLTKDGTTTTYISHRVVAFAFIDNPNNLPDVNHKDENPLNNAIDNLEWCTRDYNTNYGTRNERISKSKSIPVVGVNLEDSSIIRFQSSREAGKNGFDQGSISACTNGKYPSHRGYQWFKESEYQNNLLMKEVM